MAKKQNTVSDQLTELKQDFHDLWVALSQDPKKQARRERTWTILSGILGVAATVGARKLTTKIWHVLTGEDPPATQKAREEAAQEARAEAMQSTTRTHTETIAR